MRNLYREFLRLIPSPALQVGTVTQVGTGFAVVEFPGGGTARVRGEAQIGDKVFVRDGVIEGPAPNLPVEVITL